MKYVILCLIALAVCIALGALVTALIGHSLKKRDRRLARPAAVLMTVVFALAIACAAMFGYLEIYYHADGEAAAALESGDGVNVSHEGRVWAFDGPGTRAALAFYPGAKVEAEAYAPLLRELAENGVDCFLAEMPFRMAIFGSGAAGDIIAAHDYEDWYVGGHSMGGMTAAGYAAGHPDEVAGVIMLAAYSTEKLDDGLELFSVYGTEDGCLERAVYEENRSNWPQNSHVAESVIPGANHAQFGSYGAQSGDGEPGITAEEQRHMTADQIARFILAG